MILLDETLPLLDFVALHMTPRRAWENPGYLHGHCGYWAPLEEQQDRRCQARSDLQSTSLTVVPFSLVSALHISKRRLEMWKAAWQWVISSSQYCCERWHCCPSLTSSKSFQNIVLMKFDVTCDIHVLNAQWHFRWTAVLTKQCR